MKLATLEQIFQSLNQAGRPRDLDDIDADSFLQNSVKARYTSISMGEYQMTLFDRINKILKKYATENDTSIINASELDGFFHALACSPDLIPPSTWMPAIWGDEEAAPEWPDMKSAQAFINDVMLHYNEVMNDLNYNDCAPLFLEEDTDNGTRIIVDDWCIGFQRGLGIIKDIETKMEDHGELLFPLMLFSSDEFSENLKALTEDQINELHEAIPLCVLEIQKALGATIAARVNAGRTSAEPFTRSTPKSGRNDPCPCGSGRKYKKCCGAN